MVQTLDLHDGNDLSTKKALSAISLTVAKARRVVVVTGAGISCSCGIPVRLTLKQTKPTSLIRTCRISALLMACTTSSNPATPTSLSKDATSSTPPYSVTLPLLVCFILSSLDSNQRSTKRSLRQHIVSSRPLTRRGNFSDRIRRISMVWKIVLGCWEPRLMPR